MEENKLEVKATPTGQSPWVWVRLDKSMLMNLEGMESITYYGGKTVAIYPYTGPSRQITCETDELARETYFFICRQLGREKEFKDKPSSIISGCEGCDEYKDCAILADVLNCQYAKTYMENK